MITLIPAVLSTKQGHDYVGGSRIWNEAMVSAFRSLSETQASADATVSSAGGGPSVATLRASRP